MDQRLRCPVVSPAEVSHGRPQPSAARPLRPPGEAAPPCRRRQRARGEPLASHWRGLWPVSGTGTARAPHSWAPGPGTRRSSRKCQLSSTPSLSGTRGSSRGSSSARPPPVAPGSRCSHPDPLRACALPGARCHPAPRTVGAGGGGDRDPRTWFPAHLPPTLLLVFLPDGLSATSSISIPRNQLCTGHNVPAPSTRARACALEARQWGRPEGKRKTTDARCAPFKQPHRRVRKCPKQPTSGQSPLDAGRTQALSLPRGTSTTRALLCSGCPRVPPPAVRMRVSIPGLQGARTARTACLPP